ncbi:hypothetical protein EAX61_10100 [Dokdonia sinensis]|uniref:Beta-carotene 15,15'-monooxygenase n=1 Tax=Dokdonia sinensis TaxID=2479847 RepID=A0A3M0FYZ7_9FLAO|nr:hypothetical protein [Dokdonia sinensis]RMB57970.1 hypothetical protein EAX61_10100 [Dokdonia sinensis]
MLTSFFGSTKPATLIIVICYMTVTYFLANLGAFTLDVNASEITRVSGFWLLYIFTMFVLNFVAQKNDLTKRNAFKIILFAAFTAAIPTALVNTQVLVAGMCVLLAIRRIISLRSGLAVERKIFDAAFWIGIASLFYFWSILFYGVLYFGILIFVAYNFRYWFIPIIGAGCVAIFKTCYVLYMNDNTSFIWQFYDPISFEFSGYNEGAILIAISFFIGIFAWTIFNYIRGYQAAAMKQAPVYILIIVIAGVGLTLTILAPSKNGDEWYFFIPALCIITANYLEKAKGKIFKDLFLGVIILLPFLILYLS